MSKKDLSLEDLVDLYSITRLGTENNSNHKRSSKFHLSLEQEFEDPFKRREFIYFPDEEKRRESIYIRGLDKDIKEKYSLINIIPNEIKISDNNYIKKSYRNLESIIKDDYYIENKNYIDREEKIIYSPINIGLEDTLREYISQGYRYKKRDISPEYELFRKPESKPAQAEAAPQPVEVTRQGLPGEYRPLLAVLEKQHPGIRYVSTLTLADQSDHNVDILTFEYEVNGNKQQLHVVAKDHDEMEEKIPAFLNSLGIQTHSIYDVNTRLLIEHVGYHDLKETVRTGSESEIRKACEKALDKISQIHVLASLHLAELEEDIGLVLDTTDYVSRFKSRFLEPVSGHSVIISPQMDRLMQAYSAFTRAFDPQYFIHGDFHTGNCRMTDEECFIIDYEAARIGIKFDDLSRFVNSVLRDRPDIDAAEFSREMLGIYVDNHNQYSEEHRAPLMLNNERLADALRYSLINEQIVKIGEKVAFAEAHPKVAEKKLEESAECFDGAVRMLDGAIETADKSRSYYEWDSLSRLRAALVDYVADSPVAQLKEAAERYKTPGYKKESLILVPAA